MGVPSLKIKKKDNILGRKSNISGNDDLIRIFSAIIASVNKDLRNHQFIGWSIPNSIKILFSLSP